VSGGRVRQVAAVCLAPLVAAILAACASPAPTPTPSPTPTATPPPIPHPTGAGDLLVQTETRGGLAGPLADLTTVPDFTLYGDGTLLYAAFDQERGKRLLRRGRLTEAAVQEVLRRAVEEGSFFNSQPRYKNPTVLDAPTTRITVRTSERCRSVLADALGIDPPPETGNRDAQETAQVSRLVELQRWLTAVDLRAPKGPDWRDEGPFIPNEMNLFITRVASPQVAESARPWPFADLDLAFFTSLPTDPTQVYLEDEFAHEVYQFLIDTPTILFAQGTTLAGVTYRPHLPYEKQWRDADPCTGGASS